MNHIKQITSVAVFALLAVSTVFANPILSHKYTADPQPIVWNGRLYVYASNDDQSVKESDGYVIQAYTLVSTDDMVNWTDHGEVFRVPRDWKRGDATSARAYAPGAAVRGNMIYLYPCGAGGPVGVVTAPRPEGPFNDVLNGRPLVDRNTCTNCNVPWLFDPAVFVDDDGQAYLYYGGGGEKETPGPGQNMRVIRLNNDMISLKDANTTTVNAPRSFEAAYMHKRGNTYYFSYVNNWQGGDSHPNAAIMYMTGSSPMGPFTLRGPVLRNPSIGNKNINRDNNNHHAAIEYEGKWYMFYHDRRVADANNAPSVNQRNISVDSLVYNTDGTMKEVVVTENGVAQIKNLNPYDTIRATTMNRQQGIKTADSGENNSMILTSISEGDWIRLKGVDFGTGASKFIVRAASNSSGGRIELRTGSQTGTLIGTCNITSTSGWNTWRNFECDVDAAASAGLKNFLYLVFKGAGEPFRLSWYKFEGDTEPVIIKPDPVTGYFFHHTYEDGTQQGWAPRFGGTAENTAAQKANGSRSLVMSGRNASYNGPAFSLNTNAFASGSTYSFSVLAMYTSNSVVDTLEIHTFKLTLQYTADSTEYALLALVENVSPGQWVMLENANFTIPVGASNLLLYVEMPSNANADIYIDDAMGGIAGAEAPGRQGITSIRNSALSVSKISRPMISVKGRTLNVTSPANSNLQIRVIDVMGKTAAKFTANAGSGDMRLPAVFSLKKIPAGRYFVEVKGAGIKQSTPVILK